MHNDELNNYFNTLNKLGKTAERLPRMLATEAVNFSKERFRQQNWVGNTTENWKRRKPVRGETNHRSGSAILVSKGRLRNSMAIIGTDVPYAKAHNYGFRGTVRQSVKAHSRKTRKGRMVRVSKHSLTMQMNLPRRQFIGQSAVLTARLQRRASAEFMKALKI